MKRILLSLLFALIEISSAYSQNSLSPTQLQEDLSILGELVKELSPKLTNEDRIRIDSLIEVKKEKLKNDSLTSAEFFNFLTETDIQAKLDEHASLSITGEAFLPLLKKSYLFPIPIKLFGDHALVNSSQLSIPFGARIISINKVSVDSLLKSFTSEYRDTFVQRSLERQFSMVFLLKEGSFEKFTVEYGDAFGKGASETKTIDGVIFENYREIFSKTVFPLESGNLNNLINTHFFKESSTYYFQLNSFNWDKKNNKGLFYLLNSEHKNFDNKFKAIFKEISDCKTRNLIIDLRYNYGGNLKVPAILYSYIAKQAIFESISLKMQDFDIPAPDLLRKISSDQIENKKQVEKFIKKYKKQFVKSDKGYVWKIAEKETVEPQKRRFKGKVYLLVSGRSISASAYFAALFRSENRGVIVGEEMGGSFRSLTAGQTLTYQLPNSKIDFEVPIMEVNFSNKLYEKIGQDRIRPAVEFSISEQKTYFLARKDIEIEKVQEIVQEQK